jgi:hypothetical protein
MKLRTSIIALGSAAFAATVTTSAQIIIRGTDAPDNSATHSEVTINTGDRNVVPLIKDSKDTKVDSATQITESVTRARLNDGSYFDWQRSTATKKELSPDKSISSTDVVEKDRQGQEHFSRHTDETISKSDSGEIAETKMYTRNTSGQLVLDRVLDANTVKGADGTANTTRLEKVPDVNGNLVVKTQREEVAVPHGPNENVVMSKTMAADHLTGKLAVTAQETTSITTDGGTKRTDNTILTPGRTGWELSGRTTTTETTGANGSVTRETIEQGRSLFSEKTGDAMQEALVPQRKIVEQEVRQPNGTTVLQRDVFHRDVNGDWKTESFSTKEADKGRINGS